MEKGRWQVNGINLDITDFLQQDGVEDGHIKRIFILDAFVDAEEADVFMDVMDVYLKSEDYLTFTRGNSLMEAKFVEFIYQLDKEGCRMRLVIQPKGYDTGAQPEYLQRKDKTRKGINNMLLKFMESQNMLDRKTIEAGYERQESLLVAEPVTDIEDCLQETGRSLNHLRKDYR